MGVLAMLEIDGDPDTVQAALARVDELLPATPGLVLRMTAPTETGAVLFQLWESQEARDRNAHDDEHAEALRTSGMLDAMQSTRLRVFEGAQVLRVLAEAVR